MILDILADSARERVKASKGVISFDEIKDRAKVFLRNENPVDLKDLKFEKAFKREGISFICEVKRASPSAGIISEDFPYKDIAIEYMKAGADAISVLTEPEFFKGDNSFLEEISKIVDTPILRKDFVIDEYQIYESKLLGASAVLLICALHDRETIKNYIKVCDFLGLAHLVEAHDEAEVTMALEAGARVIGVNNRDLKTFKVDINNCLSLRSLVPRDKIFIAESGIHTRDDIRMLEEADVDGVLIGEALMKSRNKKEDILRLKGLVCDVLREGEGVWLNRLGIGPDKPSATDDKGDKLGNLKKGLKED